MRSFKEEIRTVNKALKACEEKDLYSPELDSRQEDLKQQFMEIWMLGFLQAILHKQELNGLVKFPHEDEDTAKRMGDVAEPLLLEDFYSFGEGD